MSKITYANKQTAVDPNNPSPNEIFYATDANEVKTSVNALYDRLDNIRLVDGFVSGPDLVAINTTDVAIQTFTQNIALIYNANNFQYTRIAGAADLTFTATPDATFDKGCIIQANGTTISLKQGVAAANVIYPTPDTGYVQLYSFIISTTGINSINTALAGYVELNASNIGDINLTGNIDASGSIAQGSVISKVIKADANGLLVGIDGTAAEYIAGDGSLIPFPIAGQAGSLVTEVRNVSGATMTKGTVVYINGANLNKPTIAKALATSDATSSRTFGLLQNDIPNNTNGYCVMIGELSNLNTLSFTEGTQLYLSGLIAGAYTSSKQLAPVHLVYIGKVTRSHATLGQIEVGIQNGFELEELHDVAISSPLQSHGIFWNSALSLWMNSSIATALGYTPVDAGGGGSSNFLSKFTGSTTIGLSQIYDNGTNVGIGTTSNYSGNKFQVTNAILGTARISIDNQYNDNSAIAGFQLSAYGGSWAIDTYSSNTFTNPLTFKFGSTVRMRIASTGNVGIGTINPSEKLHVNGNTLIPLNNSYYCYTVGYGVGTGNGLEIFTGDLIRFINGGKSGTEAMRIASSGSVGIGTANPHGKFELSNGTQSLVLEPSTGYNGPYIQSYNYASSVYLPLDYIAQSHHFNISGSEKMRIASSGNVGIGTTNPLYQLHLAKSSGNSQIGIDCGSASNSQIQFLQAGAFGAAITYVSSDASLRINNGGTDRIFINSSGNVGIGTTAPTSKLQVVGLPSYADNTTAIAGGLTAGAFYHTAGVLKVVI